MSKRKKYRKEFDYSYTLGAFPTFELVTYQPEKILGVVIHSQSTIDIKAIEKAAEIHCFPIETDDKLFQILSPKSNCYILSFFKKEAMTIKKNVTHLVLDNPSNHGNFGTILRTALGFRVTNIAMIKPGLDFFHPQVIRSSMGAIFNLSIESFPSFQAYKKSNPTQQIYPFILNGRTELSQVTFPPTSLSLVFGNEATGLSDFYETEGESVYIAHENKIDSLNLPMAVGISLYTIYKK